MSHEAAGVTSLVTSLLVVSIKTCQQLPYCVSPEGREEGKAYSYCQLKLEEPVTWVSTGFTNEADRFSDQETGLGTTTDIWPEQAQ